MSDLLRMMMAWIVIWAVPGVAFFILLAMTSIIEDREICEMAIVHKVEIDMDAEETSVIGKAGGIWAGVEIRFTGGAPAVNLSFEVELEEGVWSSWAALSNTNTNAFHVFSTTTTLPNGTSGSGESHLSPPNRWRWVVSDAGGGINTGQVTFYMFFDQ